MNLERGREPLDPVPFSVSARVAMQLGRESISSSVVAILELVKNAYDADAENVQVSFFGLDTDNPVLVIDDNGSGMTLQELQDYWMVIGNDNKALLRKSRSKKRVLVGEKGLGRLGLDRLAHVTTVQTFSETNPFGAELVIDWRKYEENIHARLEAITHELYRIPKTFNDEFSDGMIEKKKGTRLVMYGLKDHWTYDNVAKLRRELALLVSPFAGIHDFGVWLSSGMGWDVDGQVGSREMLRAAEWKLTSQLQQTQSGIYIVDHVMSSAPGKPEFKFSQPWPEIFRQKENQQPQCGPVEFEMYFYPRRDVQSVREEFGLDEGQLRTFMEANQGIRIYRDNFRVKPYGDPSGEGDWLNLAFRRVKNPEGVRQPGYWRVGYNQVVGAVFLERDRNFALLDQTNREGIVEGIAYFDLRRFVLHAVEFFERRRQEYERSQVRKTKFERATEEAAASSQVASEAFDQLKSQVANMVGLLKDGGATVESDEVSTTVQELLDTVSVAEKAIAESKEAHQELTRASEEQKMEFDQQKDTLGNLASLGILAAAFGHETLGYSNLVVNNVGLLKSNIQSVLPCAEPEVIEEIQNNITDLEYGARQIRTFAGFTLGNVRPDKRKRVKLYLNRVVKEVFEVFDLPATRKIQVELDFPKDTPPILAFHIDWESIFINLITNAVWALENKPDGQRIVRVRGRVVKAYLEIAFADSGCGIEAGIKDRIFEPRFSTKRNMRGDIVGTGMGLAIVENFVHSNDGTINVESSSDLDGAQFTIRIPIPNLSDRGNKKNDRN